MSHSKFKFKSVGKRYDETEGNLARQSKVRPLGIKTPLRDTGTDDIFDMHTDIREQAKDNLKNLLLTNHGERLVQHNFGANLKSILYDYAEDDAFKSTVSKFIKNAVEAHLPALYIQDIETVILSDEEKRHVSRSGFAKKMKLRVVFGIPQLQMTGLFVEVEMFIGG